MPTETYTDCRSEEGITVGLIDTIMTAARILAGRDLSSAPVKEALRDMAHDEDVKLVMELAQSQWADGVNLPRLSKLITRGRNG